MSRSQTLLCCAATALFAVLPGSATACGDKLSVIGGGVTFDKFAAEHRGNIVMLVAPDSPLRAANEDLKLHQALQKAGHRVRTVESTAELAAVLDRSPVDVVLVSIGKDADFDHALAGRTGAPAMLRVAYKSDPAVVAAASKQGECFVLAARKQDQELVHRVGAIVAQRTKHVGAQCDTIKAKTTTT